MKTRSPRLSGLGVDLVELRRADRFVRSHRKSLESFFLPREYRWLLRSRSPKTTFALLFASKEAVSKALRLTIVHPGQFRWFSVALGPKRRFPRWTLKSVAASSGAAPITPASPWPGRGSLSVRLCGHLRDKHKRIRFALEPFKVRGALGVIALAYRV